MPLTTSERQQPVPFDPQSDYGNTLTIDDGPSDYHDVLDSTFIRDALLRDARRVLPPGTYFEIRAVRLSNINGVRKVAWYYSPNALRSYTRIRTPWQGGYRLLAWSRA